MTTRKLTPFGTLVKKRLIDLGKTQLQLADEVGTTYKYLNLIFIGERSGKKYIHPILNALDLPKEQVDKLLEEEAT